MNKMIKKIGVLVASVFSLLNVTQLGQAIDDFSGIANVLSVLWGV